MDDQAAVKALSDARDSGENLSARSTGAPSGIKIQDLESTSALFTLLYVCFKLSFYIFMLLTGFPFRNIA